ncbi:MAG: alpha/beta fold hydrolase [Candidatus Nanopelagicales bacterium]
MTRTIHRHGLVATVTGDGPPLLLIHGLGSSRTIWRGLADELAQNFTTIAVDLPGHGESGWLSPAPDEFSPADHAEAVKPLIDEFGGVVHVAGNSMGGWVGLEMAANGWAASLTGLCSAGLEIEPWTSRSDELVLRRRLARVLGPVLAPATGLVARTPALRSIIMKDATADFDSLDPSVLVDAAEAMREARGFYPSHDALLNHLFTRSDQIGADVPVSVVWGVQDTLLPPDRQLRSAPPAHAEWIVLDDCAHVPMWDQPERTVEIIKATAGVA